MAFADIISTGLIALGVLAALFAGLAGGKPERLGAAIWGCGFALTIVAQVVGGMAPFSAFMAIDFAVSVAFALLALRYPDKLWPGIAACAQFLVFVFSATRAIRFPLSEEVYLIALNLSGLGLTCALIFGTWASRWLRRPQSEWERFELSLT